MRAATPRCSGMNASTLGTPRTSPARYGRPSATISASGCAARNAASAGVAITTSPTQFGRRTRIRCGVVPRAAG